MKNYPEQPHTKHQPDGEKPSHIKSSKHVGAGHNDSMNRMPHPFNEQPPMNESGEGK